MKRRRSMNGEEVVKGGIMAREKKSMFLGMDKLNQLTHMIHFFASLDPILEGLQRAAKKYPDDFRGIDPEEVKAKLRETNCVHPGNPNGCNTNELMISRLQATLQSQRRTGYYVQGRSTVTRCLKDELGTGRSSIWQTQFCVATRSRQLDVPQFLQHLTGMWTFQRKIEGRFGDRGYTAWDASDPKYIPQVPQRVAELQRRISAPLLDKGWVEISFDGFDLKLEIPDVTGLFLYGNSIRAEREAQLVLQVTLDYDTFLQLVFSAEELQPWIDSLLTQFNEAFCPPGSEVPEIAA